MDEALSTKEAASRPVVRCWERRGCDEDMLEGCPHNVPGEPCPADCHYAACHRERHVVCTDLNILLNPDRYYDAAIKEVCRFCEHFLVNGPSMDERPADAPRRAQPNRFML